MNVREILSACSDNSILCSPCYLLQFPLMIEYEGVSPWSPAHQVLLAPDIGVGGVQHTPLPPLETGTALNPSSEDHLIHAGQSVGFWISKCSLEQMLQSRPEPAVSAVHNHGQVLGDDGGLGAALKLT